MQIKEELLTKSGNRDGKRSLLAGKRDKIRWLLWEEALPKNFIREQKEKANLDFLIFLDKSFTQKERIEAFARFASPKGTRTVFPREVFETCGLSQESAIRDLYQVANEMGLSILCGSYPEDREEFPFLERGKYFLEKS